MKKLLLSLTLAIGLCVNYAHAQTRTITGTVTSSEDGSALPGVSVAIKGTTTGDVTDVDGTFSINVSGSNVVLLFSYVGFETMEVSVGNQSMVNAVISS